MDPIVTREKNKAEKEVQEIRERYRSMLGVDPGVDI